jgi:hypothetical protein
MNPWQQLIVPMWFHQVHLVQIVVLLNVHHVLAMQHKLVKLFIPILMDGITLAIVQTLIIITKRDLAFQALA